MKKNLIIIMFLCTTLVSAQDVIVLKDGSTILSKVLEVNTADIKYKKISNQNGPTYTISKSEIMSINYENGDKDVFNGDKYTMSSNTVSLSERLINKPAASYNSEIISLYNKIYNTTIEKKNTPAKYFLLIFGVKESSIMTNEDLEMKFVRENMKYPFASSITYSVYNIKLTNKTDKTIYIDKGNCFKLYNNGEFLCYYDNTEQITVNMGGGSGTSLGLGSVAGALGIGGTVGQIAGGVSVGGGTSHSVSTTYSQQRVIAIPPHGTRNLTEEKWVKTKEGNLLSGADYTKVEEAESFEYLTSKPQELLKLKRGMVNKGFVQTFREDEIPWKRVYIITYSTDESFSTYSTLKSELYIHEIIGCSFRAEQEIVEGFNENTIAALYWTHKE